MSAKMSVHSDKTFEMEYNLSLDRKPVGDGVLIYDFPEKGWSTMYHVGDIYLCTSPYPVTLSTPESNTSFETSMP
jgi:hypothetical protein